MDGIDYCWSFLYALEHICIAVTVTEAVVMESDNLCQCNQQNFLNIKQK